MKNTSNPPMLRYKTNKLRMFDILTRVIIMGETTSHHITWRFEPSTGPLSDKLQQFLTLTINFPHADLDGDEDCNEQKIKVNSEDWEFDVVEKKLDVLDEEHREEMERKSKRDFLLRRMTTEERDLLGHNNWRDPDPDGEAKTLAEKVLAATPTHSTKSKGRSKA